MRKKKYCENTQLLFIDSDSLKYDVCTDAYYHAMWAMKVEFDLARYRKSRPFYDASNKKVVGNFKEHASGHSITEFVRLNAKMYSYQTRNTVTASSP